MPTLGRRGNNTNNQGHDNFWRRRARQQDRYHFEKDVAFAEYKVRRDRVRDAQNAERMALAHRRQQLYEEKLRRDEWLRRKY